MGGKKSELETEHGRLRHARKLRGYRDASAAARAIGQKVPTYLAHENGSRTYRDDADRYAAFYRVSLDWLITGKGPAPGEDDLYQKILRLPSEKRSQALDFIEFLRGKKS